MPECQGRILLPILLLLVGLPACFQGAPAVYLDTGNSNPDGPPSQDHRMTDGAQSDFDAGKLECTGNGAPATPRCCVSGCGESINPTQEATCQGGFWSCTGVLLGGTPENLCASYGATASASKPCDGPVHCDQSVLGKSEPDPVPELCCVGDCSSGQVAKRVCTSTTAVTQKYVCPAESTPLSECPNPRDDCGGALNNYRANGYKLP